MKMENDKSIILSPEYELKRQEIESLSKEYSILLEEQEAMLNREKQVLLIKYNLEIGKHILPYLEKHLKFLRLKRKIEILQMHLNRNEKTDLSLIEKTLDQEFKDWMDRISGLENDILISRFAVITETDGITYKKIQEIYRKLVRGLHPDLNKDLDERMKILWNRVQTAYQNLDLDELKNLEILFDSDREAFMESDIDAMQKKIEFLWKKIENISQFLSALQKTFPFTMREKIYDPEWVKSEVQEYQNKSEEIEGLLPEYEKIYRHLLVQLYGLIQEHPENL